MHQGPVSCNIHHRPGPLFPTFLHGGPTIVPLRLSVPCSLSECTCCTSEPPFHKVYILAVLGTQTLLRVYLLYHPCKICTCCTIQTLSREYLEHKNLMYLPCTKCTKIPDMMIIISYFHTTSLVVETYCKVICHNFPSALLPDGPSL